MILSVVDIFHEGKVTLPIVRAFRCGSIAGRKFWHPIIKDLDQGGDLKKLRVVISKSSGS